MAPLGKAVLGRGDPEVITLAFQLAGFVAVRALQEPMASFVTQAVRTRQEPMVELLLV